MNDDSPASFSVVLRAAGDLAAILDTLAALPGPPREVCLVEPWSQGSADQVMAARVKVVSEPLDRDAVARNHAVAAAAGDVVVCQDSVPPADDLFMRLGRCLADRQVAAVFVASGCAAFRRVDLELIGGFDEAQRDGDDVIDACRRLEASGRRVVWLSAAPPLLREPAAAAPPCLMAPGLVRRRRQAFRPLAVGPQPSRPAMPADCIDPLADAPAPVQADRRASEDSVPWGGMRRALRQTWASLLPHGTRCALVGYPDHWNVGDAAIWWGTRRLLAEIGVAADYACDPWSYEPAALEAAVPSGPLLILGGGNLGDAYRHEQSLRERLLRDFPRRRIIQLPQSVWFASPQRAESLADLLVHAGDVTLLLRDTASLAFARATFRCDSALCPDSALAVDLPGGWGPPEAPMLALWRTDTEARERAEAMGDDVVVADWTSPGLEVGLMSTAARGFHEWVGAPPAEIGSCPRRRRLAWRRLPWLWDQLAEDRTLRGCRILARGRVVLTDRLHAHLLCTLMRKPHVVCDSANGKIFAYRDTWRIDDPLVRYASTRAEAVSLGRDLLAATAAHDAGDAGP